jgi:DNA polymerase-4
VEQRDDPELRGKPVAVGGRQRGVVMAASYEARTFGVRSAMPSATAKRLCAELVFVKPRFDVYKEVSRQIREIFLEYHAARRTVVARRGLSRRHHQPQEHAAGERHRPRDPRPHPGAHRPHRLGGHLLQQVSGQARVGSSQAQRSDRDSRPEKGAAFVEDLPVAKFHGIGPKTAEKMNRLGIHTGADLRNQSMEFLEEYFGKAGTWYHAIARGQDDRRVVPNRPRKSVGSETTFMEGSRPAGRGRARASPRCSMTSGPTVSAPACSAAR